MIKLKQCPFCGSEEIFFVFGSLNCHGCGASGPCTLDEKIAAKHWNKRTGLSKRKKK